MKIITSLKILASSALLLCLTTPVHATEDPSVSFDEALNLNQWNKNSVLLEIPDANHVFNSKHPWDNAIMPLALQTVVSNSIKFILD